MRKALLVVTLIASSFAGGAVVNGPGLKHAKSWLVDQLTEAPAGEGTSSSEDPLAEDFPAAEIPRITTPDDQATEAAQEPPAPRQAEPASPKADKPPPGAAATGAPSQPPSTPAATIPAATPSADNNTATVPPLTPPVGETPAPAAPPPPGEVPAPPAPQATAATTATTAPAIPFADAPDSKAPAHAVVPPAASAAAVAAASPETRPPAGNVALDGSVQPASLPNLPAKATGSSDPGATWADVHRRLKDLGVTRFWVEGEPGGVVRFRCAIPIAGERAVAQQFEAEGDDPLQAADTVLRRVAVWRAARGQP